MSAMADSSACEKFEANMFAKNRCQNCLRTIAAHQCGNQGSKEHVAKSLECAVRASESDPGHPRDPLCIFAPQCKLYVCLGTEDTTESWQESLEYTQLSCRNEQESEEASLRLDAGTIPSNDPGSNAMLSKDLELTQHLSNILGSEKGDISYFASQKKEVQPENLHSDRPRWAEATSYGTAASWSCLKPEFRTMSQVCGESRRKHQVESSYFSLECHKGESSCSISTSCIDQSTSSAHGNAPGAGRWATSFHGSSEGLHGLMRQEYTALADLPKPRRLHHQEAFEKVRSRAHSPGRAEVERIFGQERRKSETLEMFQALEEGLLERLDSKSLKLAKEGRLVRRQSSPTLFREVKKKFPREPEQPFRRQSLCVGQPDQQPKSPTQKLKTESQSRGTSLHPATPASQQMSRDGRKSEEPVHPLKSSAERGLFHPLAHGRPHDRKSPLGALCGESPLKNSIQNRWRKCQDALQTANPLKILDKNPGGFTRQPERYKESDRKARGKPLLLIDTSEQSRKNIRDSQDVIYAAGPGSKIAARGKSGHPLACSKLVDNRGEAKFGNIFSPGRFTGSQRESRCSVSLGKYNQSNLREVKHSPSLGVLKKDGQTYVEVAKHTGGQRYCDVSEKPLENNWKSQRETRSLRASTNGSWLGKRDQSAPFTPRQENDLKDSHTPLGLADPTVTGQKKFGQRESPLSGRTGTSQESQKKSHSHVHPVPPLGKEMSQGGCFHSAKPGQQQLENNGGKQGSPAEWSVGEWEDWPSPLGPEKQLENDEEKLFCQNQEDRGHAMRSHVLSLDTSKKQKV